MNDLVRKKNEPLPDESLVFRAIRSKSWVHRDTGKLQATAFLLREDETNGLSVSESALNAVKRLKRVNQAARLEVLRIRVAQRDDGRPLGLDVISDPQEYDPVHALVTGLPHYTNTDDAMEAADALLKCTSSQIITVDLSAPG